MLNIKEVLEGIKKKRSCGDESLSDFELKCVSVKKFYGDLKRAGDLKKMRRLRCLLYYYPNMLENNSFSLIEKCINKPSDTILMVSYKRTWFYNHEKYAIEKSNCNYNVDKRNFYVEHFFEFYGI